MDVRERLLSVCGLGMQLLIKNIQTALRTVKGSAG